MEKATKAIHRRGVRLMNGEHSSLALIISGLKDVKSELKAFQSAQSRVARDIVEWAHAEDNAALWGILADIHRFNSIWVESQNDFLETVNGVRHHFEMILVEEKTAAQARAKASRAEQKQLKILEEFQKRAKKAATGDDMRLISKLSDARFAKDSAQIEAIAITKELAACKLMRLKESLIKLSDGYLEMGRKMSMTFEAQKRLVETLPDELESTVGGLEQHVSGHFDHFKGCQAHKDYQTPQKENDGPPPPYSSNVSEFAIPPASATSCPQSTRLTLNLQNSSSAS